MLKSGRYLLDSLIDRVTPRQLINDLIDTEENNSKENMTLQLSSTTPGSQSSSRATGAPVASVGSDVTDSTAGVSGMTSTSHGSGASDKNYEDLLRERNELLRHREEMKMRFSQSLQADASAYDGNTVRMGGRRPAYKGQDSSNYTRVNELASFVFSNLKVLPDDWFKFSVVPNSICDRIMKCGVDVPYEFSNEFYFNNVLRKMFLMKYRSLKTNFTTVCRDLYMSKCFVLMPPLYASRLS